MPHRALASVPIRPVPSSKGLGMNVLAKSLFTRTPVTATPETSIEQTLKLMDQNKVGSVIILSPDRNVPVGIITLQDVLRRVARPQIDLLNPVSMVMSSDILALGSNATAHQAARLMARKQLRHVLIVDDNKCLLGIISKNDLYDVLCSSCVYMRNAKSGE